MNHVDRFALTAQAFRPAAPVNHQDMFRGRAAQLVELQDLLLDVGRHGVIYGERGVGKTSLAAVSISLHADRAVALRVNCESTDTFQSVWEKVAAAFDEEAEAGLGVADHVDVREVLRRAADVLRDGDIGADRIRAALRIIDSTVPLILFLDEFDVLGAPSTKAMFADTIKTLSDQLIGSTMVLVGVADDITSLLDAHESVERAISQIRMPRMAEEDIVSILANGFAHCQMEPTEEALAYLASLPKGLPTYAHLLGQAAARRAAFEEGKVVQVTSEHAEIAVADAIEKAQQSIQSAYHKATSSPRPKHYFKEVLLACAMVDGDQFGYFTPGELQDPHERLTGKRSIGTFNNHLIAFCEPARGPVLERTGEERKRRYRFKNPLLQPYVLMEGLAAGLIDISDVAAATS